jgi:uncharacterized protein (UPF0335 family)
MSEQVTAAELLQFVEQYEDLDARKKGIADEQKDLVSELKSRGYSAPIFREIIRLRKMKPDDRAERDAVLDLYLAALGMV